MDARLIAALLAVTGLGAGRADTRDVDRFRKPLVPGATSSDTNNSNGAGGIPALMISVGPQNTARATRRFSRNPASKSSVTSPASSPKCSRRSRQARRATASPSARKSTKAN